ncbi:hypothetical protein [Roseovarius sp.]|uniref:hypothetical protein n=1 Tax=Roseovarius sp. TaxID=1486281 RepID=UPI003A96A9B6
MSDFTITSNYTVETYTIAVPYDGSGFDASQIRDVTYVDVDGVDYLYYSGLPFGNSYDLGLALSYDDGETWEKVSDQPIVSNAESPYWADFRLAAVSVEYTDGLFEMWYWGNNTNLFTSSSNVVAFGYATSTDGLNWTFANDPIRIEAGSREGARLIEMVHFGDSYLAYYQDLNSGAANPLILITSPDGQVFGDNDTEVDFATGNRLLTAAVHPDLPDLFFSLWINNDTGQQFLASSEDGQSFTVISDVEIPFTPADMAFEGDQLLFYGTKSFGPVIWSYNNSSGVVGSMDFDLTVVDGPTDPIPFDINVLTAMQLAAASYAPLEIDRDAAVAPDVIDYLGTDARDAENALYSDLFESGTTTLKLVENFSVGDTQITDENGFYVRENAAALVAQADDTLFIVFRGTNDNTETFANVLKAIYRPTKDALEELPLDPLQRQGTLASLAALNGVKNSNGNGKGQDKIIDKVTERAVPEYVKSPDVEDWLNLDSHYSLFKDLTNAVEDMVTSSRTDTTLAEITNVVFIGHSMGGGMAQYAMSDFADGMHDVSYSAYAFAPSGIEDNRRNEDLDRFEPDDRIVNLRFDNDPIRYSSVGTEQRGDQIILSSQGTGGHETALYLNAAELLLDAGFSAPGEFVDADEQVFAQISVRADGANGAEFFDVGFPSDAFVGTRGSDTITPKLLLGEGSVVAGLEGDDVIDLGLSTGADAIIFRSGDGHDEITGFNAEEDQLVLRGFENSDPVSIAPSGGSVVFPDLFPPDTLVATWSDGSSITFVDLDDVEEFSLAVFGVLPDDPFVLA